MRAFMRAVVITWLRTRLSFKIFRSVHMSIIGSRTPFLNANESKNGFRLNGNSAGICLIHFRLPSYPMFYREF